MQVLKQEWPIFLLALGFLTRLPVPAVKEPIEPKMQEITRYFPVVGFLIGLILAAFYSFLSAFTSVEISIVLTIAMSLLITGAFHEDGLADTFDGFGGGWTREKKLAIMKDSRIGTYGSSALWVSLMLQALLLVSIPNICLALIVSQSLSRIVPVILMALLSYVQLEQQSKSQLIAQTVSTKNLSLIAITGCLLLFITACYSPLISVKIIMALLIVILVCKYWFNQQIQGYVGDTLGASQQFALIVLYFCWV